MGLKHTQSVVPSFEWCLDTANIYPGYLCLLPLVSKPSSLGHIFFSSSALREGQAAHDSLKLAWTIG